MRPAPRFRSGLLDLARGLLNKLIVGPIKYRSPSGYDARRFWRDRFARYGNSLRGAGHEGLSEAENRSAYEEDAQVLAAFVRRGGLDFPSARVLDIGCGPGFYTQLHADLGVDSYTGLDVTDVLFPELRSRFPRYQFIRCDVTEDRLHGEYDLVLMIDVAEHIVTEQALDQAMDNVKRVTGARSLFVIGPVMERGRRRLFYVRFWSVDEILGRFPGYSTLGPVPFRNGLLMGIRPRP